MANKTLIHNTAYREDYAGIRFIEPVRVDGLDRTGNVYTQAAQRLPKLGDYHPTLPLCRVASITIYPFANSRDSVDAEIEYVQCPLRLLLDVRVNGVSAMIPTQFDIDGKMMAVDYKPGENPDSYCWDEPKSALGETYNWNYVKLDKLQPDTILEFIYREVGCPLAKSQRFRGRLNEGQFQEQPPRSWLCLDISGNFASPMVYNIFDTPEQYAYNVRYVFQFKPTFQRFGESVIGGPAWDQLSIFVDQNSGRIPSDINPAEGGFPDQTRGNGWRQFEVYGTENFDDLLLPNVAKGPTSNMNQ